MFVLRQACSNSSVISSALLEKQQLCWVFTEARAHCRWLRESGKLRKFSLINAPRVLIVINGDEMEAGEQGGEAV